MISVIIPVYNTKEEYLRQCLESVLNQTFRNIEVIIIDDGSTVEIKPIIDSYKDDRIKYIYQENKGLSGARNTGLTVANGNYISFVDSDDWLANDAYEKLYKKAEENDLDALFFDFCSYNDQTKNISTVIDTYAMPYELENQVFDYRNIINTIMSITETAWSKLFKREFLNKNNLRFEEGIIFEDTEFFFRFIFKAKKMGVIHLPLYYYRQNVKGSITKKCNKKHFDCIKVFESAEKTLRENNVFETAKIPFYSSKLSVFKLRYDEISPDLQTEFKEKIKEDLSKISLTKEDWKALPKFSRRIYEDFMYKSSALKKAIRWLKKRIYSSERKDGYKTKYICFFKIKKEIKD